MANLQDFFRQFGTYLVEQEVFAIIRRIDTDGDARLSFEEFADFFKTQVNENTELIKPKPKGLRGSHLMSTDSKQGASIE